MPQLTGKQVGRIGYGLMGLTWRPEPVNFDQASGAMRTALACGANAWNAGEFYGTEEYNSLHLLNTYFSKHPEDAEKVHLNVKGCVTHHGPDGSREGVRSSVENCLRILDGKKKIDSFEPARVDKSVAIEDTMKYFKELIDEGKIGGVALSEASAETIKRAAKVQKIDSVEVEFSLFCTEMLENGVAKTCAELDIPMLAYSPLSRGMLTGTLTKDTKFNDFRAGIPRFQPENMENNLKLVDRVKKVAERKGVTVGQVAIAWAKSYSGRKGFPTIIPIPGATTDSRVKENCIDVGLSEQDLQDIGQILKTCEVAGDRYPSAMMASLWG